MKDSARCAVREELTLLITETVTVPRGADRFYNISYKVYTALERENPHYNQDPLKGYGKDGG